MIWIEFSVFFRFIYCKSRTDRPTMKTTIQSSIFLTNFKIFTQNWSLIMKNMTMMTKKKVMKSKKSHIKTAFIIRCAKMPEGTKKNHRQTENIILIDNLTLCLCQLFFSLDSMRYKKKYVLLLYQNQRQ